MKNALRIILYFIFVAVGFNLSGGVMALLMDFAPSSCGQAPLLPGWAFAGALLNMVVRERVVVPKSTILTFWLVTLGPFVLNYLNIRGILLVSTSIFFSDVAIRLLYLSAFVVSFLTLNKLRHR